ncbi:MAG: hypothetical protein CMF25_05310 [Kangiellaceae bacterium]|nr:hypothetical protein [Kangiellaceae bacterium]|tara:strand:- start:33428 stop:34504 length:1077 start_codon:yes stop_codon:yes gene_type:complete
MPIKTKVKIVAIAKDEAAYFADWVFHHLYFGFDAIDIYLNRTSDNSKDVLEKITTHHPNVNFQYADWLDTCPDAVGKFLQYCVYAKAFAEEKAKSEYTHILFIDIDEMWTPQDFKSSIHDCLAKQPKHSSISFQWANLLGEEQQFASIPHSLRIIKSSTVKSIVSLSTDVEKIQLHLPEFVRNNNFQGCFLSDGSPFEHAAKNYQQLARGNQIELKPYFILHRMYRSEIEYISLLYRGRPSDNIPLKFNRGGYLRSARTMRELTFPHSPHNKYETDKQAFIRKLNLSREQRHAQAYVLKRAQKAISIIPSLIEQYESEIKNAFSGVNNKNVQRAISGAPIKKSPVSWLKGIKNTVKQG